MAMTCAALAVATLLLPLSAAVGFPKEREIAPGVRMPTMSLGSCCGSDPVLGVPAWLAAGGVGIDTAFDYHNQENIAKVLEAAEPAVSRRGVFITTKVPAGLGLSEKSQADCSLDPDASFDKVLRDVKQLQVGYVDLVLLHGPCQLWGSFSEEDPAAANAAQWQGLQKALDLGLTRAIGVSNYNKWELMELMANPNTTVKPAVNQCQMSVAGDSYCFPAVGTCLHGGSHDDPTLGFCVEQGIAYEAYGTMNGCPFKDAGLAAMAGRHGVSVAQVCLLWTLQRGAIVVAGTGHNATKIPLDTRDNLAVLDMEVRLSDEEMGYINGLRPPLAALRDAGKRETTLVV